MSLTAENMGIEEQYVDCPEDILGLDWILDSYGYWWLRVVGSNGQKTTLFIQPRANYCDRGHWQVICEYYCSEHGMDTIDGADCFPRMFMSLEVAKREIQEWIAWRMYKHSKDVGELVAHNAARVI